MSRVTDDQLYSDRLPSKFGFKETNRISPTGIYQFLENWKNKYNSDYIIDWPRVDYRWLTTSFSQFRCSNKFSY